MFFDVPPCSIGQHTWKEEHRGQAQDHTYPDVAADTGNAPQPPPNLTLTESILLGYMAQRHDFEVEYDNDAEALISRLQPSQLTASSSTVPKDPDEEDSERVDIALLAAHVDMYKGKLKERERRKKVSRDFGLIS